MNLYPRAWRPLAIMLGLFAVVTVSPPSAQYAPNGNAGYGLQYPWLDRTLSPDARADLVLKQMTLDEKISLLHGTGWHDLGTMNLEILHSNGGVGYVPGIPRLRIPGIQMTNASYGVTRSRKKGLYSTALPDDLALAATWDGSAAYEYGALLGRELRAQGYNMSLGGGVNLARGPRDGRTFEYLGEDPILAGTIAGQVVTGTQAQHVIGNMKHFAMNDREKDRHTFNVNIDKRAMRESDLLAFEIGLSNSQAGAVMCAYNGVNGEPSCENKYLLAEVLRKDWKFPGFVLSDWGATHSTVKASAAGLDHEEPSSVFYGGAMKRAMLAGRVPMAELEEHVRRILRSEFASGIVDDPPGRGPIDVDRDLDIAQHLAEQSIVLLRNEGAQLPLNGAGLHSIAVIGAHADAAMISGAGSGQVDPPAGSALNLEKGVPWWEVWFPTSPLKALRSKAPHAKVEYDPGTNPASAVALARAADVAIVFVCQWEGEGMDLATLSLPNDQDALVEQVAAANPHTIVVLETGSPALMPWANKVSGILEAWYAGSRGADAVANVLFGEVNPCAKLPITFPLQDSDVPQPAVVKPPPSQREIGAFANLTVLFGGSSKERPPVQLYYNEGMLVGYKWYDAKRKAVLFPFGFGLSYTTFHYSGLRVNVDGEVSVNFTIKNTGNRAGAEVAEVYASFPPSAGEPPRRLIGWQKAQLNPGESRQVSLKIQTQYFSIFDVDKDEWSLVPGEYTLFVGGSSENLPLRQRVRLGKYREQSDGSEIGLLPNR